MTIVVNVNLPDEMAEKILKKFKSIDGLKEATRKIVLEMLE